MEKNDSEDSKDGMAMAMDGTCLLKLLNQDDCFVFKEPPTTASKLLIQTYPRTESPGGKNAPKQGPKNKDYLSLSLLYICLACFKSQILIGYRSML